MKLWLLTNTPSPYQIEFFREIARSGLFTLDVRFMSAVHRGTATLEEAEAQFIYKVFPSIGPSRISEEFRYHPHAVKEVLAGDHDFYILSGHYTSATFLACAVAAARRRKPWVMWLERPWPEEFRPPWSTRLSVRYPWLRAPRDFLLKLLARKCRGIFAVGTLAVEAYRKMGVPDEKLYFLPYYCDVERFARVERKECARLLAQLGYLEKVVFLYSGALIPRKGVDLLLKMFKVLAVEQPNTALIVLGEGPQRAELQRSVPEVLANRVHFAGQVEQADLPLWFGAADVFVFPSRHDGWGVVINEACGAGLPIIAADSVGAARDPRSRRPQRFYHSPGP
jgi:glycosyltransferase involved in cell wall biosynthesis